MIMEMGLLMLSICISMRKSKDRYRKDEADEYGRYNWGGKVIGLNFDDHIGDCK